MSRQFIKARYTFVDPNGLVIPKNTVGQSVVIKNSGEYDAYRYFCDFYIEGEIIRSNLPYPHPYIYDIHESYLDAETIALFD